MIEIEGWLVRADHEGNILRKSIERPNTHYVVTIINKYAVDIEMPIDQIDNIPKEKLMDILISTITNVIKNRGGKLL